MKRIVSALVCVAALASAAPAAQAQAQPWLDDPYGGRQQDQARAAVQGGQILPLEVIVRQIRQRTPGQVLSASAPQFEGDRVTYRILWDSRGRQLEYIVDARSGAVLAVNGN